MIKNKSVDQKVLYLRWGSFHGFEINKEIDKEINIEIKMQINRENIGE